MSKNDNFDYILPEKYRCYTKLFVITYDIHKARIIAKKLRSQFYHDISEMDLSIMEEDIKKNDILFIRNEITYTEYCNKYTLLLNFQKGTKTKTPDLVYYEYKHHSFIYEYKEMLAFLSKNN